MRLIPTYSDDEFNNVQIELLNEGYTWYTDCNEPIKPISVCEYPIFIVVHKDKSLNWLNEELLFEHYKQEYRKLKLNKLDLIYTEK